MAPRFRREVTLRLVGGGRRFVNAAPTHQIQASNDVLGRPIYHHSAPRPVSGAAAGLFRA